MTRRHLFTIFMLALLLGGCIPNTVPVLDIQGHRGCRGLLPENSLAAMEKALELGVTTLEMDVVISAEGEVLLSHDPFLSHEICTDTAGQPVTKENEQSFNIYKMRMEDIARCDCGSRPHPRFPDQEKQKATKPSLKKVLSHAEAYAKAQNRPRPYYNIEIKRRPEWDSIYHPPVADYVERVAAIVHWAGTGSHTTIQSFDVETLKETRKQAPFLDLVLLVDEDENYVDKIAALGFYPKTLSPDYKLVNDDMMRFAADKNLKVIPWTVNEVTEMQKLIKLGVDGIITDYPDRLLEIAAPRD